MKKRNAEYEFVNENDSWIKKSDKKRFVFMLNSCEL